MTPADEATFIDLWIAGLEQTAMAQALGIPVGTVSSRAATLVRQGKISPPSRGGAYPTQRTQARQQASPRPVQRPVQTFDTGAVHSADTGADHCTAPLSSGESGPLEFMDIGCHPG